MTPRDELSEIEDQITGLISKVSPRGRETLVAALIDIQATRLHLLGQAMTDLGLAAEGRQAESESRQAAALAAKGLRS